MFPTPHSLSITTSGASELVCPFHVDELCRPCVVYTPCGCRVSGDFETTRAHDGEACPVRRGNHLVLRPDAEPVLPGFPARTGELGTLYVPAHGVCVLRDSVQDLALYDAEGSLLLSPGMTPGAYEIERWVVGPRWRKVKLTHTQPKLVAV